MNEVDQWFDRTARRSRQPIALYPSLLSGRIAAYLRYRLRYPLLIAVVRFIVHVAEFFILLSALGGVAAFTVMVLRAGSLFISGGWWGLLEVMRERLRGYAAAGDRDSSGREIGRWLVLATALAIVTIAAGAVVLFQWGPGGADPVTRLYGFLIVIEFAIDLPVRVLHSGAFATRRVYKPAWSMLLPIGAQLAILGAGFYFYPAAAIIVAIVVSNGLGIWIAVHYTLEVYRLMGLRPSIQDRRWWLDLPRIPVRLGLQTTASGLSLRLDAVLVLALVGFYGTNTRTFDLTAGMTSWQQIDAFQFFYLILPLFRGTYESAGIFYFDLVRLRSTPALRELQLVFFRRLLVVAPIVAIFFWVLAAALGIVVLHDVPPSFLLALIPLFVLRSFIGVYQIRLFAEGRFTLHLATFALLIVLLWLVWLNPNPAGDLIEITAAMTVQLIVLIDVQHLNDRRYPPVPALVQMPEWRASLAEESVPTVTGTLRIPESITGKQKAAAVSLLRQTFSESGHFAYRSTTSLVYYERRPDGMAAPNHIELLELTGGAVSCGAVLPDPGATAPPRGPEDLIAEFRGQFPDGIIFEAHRPRSAVDMGTLDPAVLTGALPAALAALDDGKVLVQVGGRWLTPVFSRGALHLLFVLPADADRDRIRHWRQTARSNV